ncbi:MAG TPA: translocation/assembly module TamB domain-containing protein [Atribacteraceae bacterium]|nr:translocation/assembly module TamB domain-containing protein [Atribacteraceae bacterium]
MKKGWLVLGLVLVFGLVVLVFQGNRITKYLFTLVLDRFQALDHLYTLDFEAIRYQWPLGLVLDNLDIQGENAQLNTPSLTVRWSISDLLRGNIVPLLTADQITISTHTLTFWSDLPTMNLSDLPDFRLLVENLMVGGQGALPWTFSIRAQKTSGRMDVIAASELFSMEGIYRTGESAHLVVTGFTVLPGAVLQAEWDFRNEIVTAGFTSLEGISFSLVTSPEVSLDDLVLSDLRITAEGWEGFVFSGEARLALSEGFRGRLEGSWQDNQRNGDITLLFLCAPTFDEVAGTLILDSSEPAGRAHSDFVWTLSTGALWGELLDGSHWFGSPLRAVYEGHLSSVGLDVFYKIADFDCALLPVPGLVGVGTLAGKIEYAPSDGWQVTGAFSSEALTVNGFILRNPHLDLYFSEGQDIGFEGNAALLGGTVGFSGTFGATGYKLAGQFQNISPDFLWDPVIPVRGSLSGDIEIYSQEGNGETVVRLALHDGTIFWDELEIGRVGGGEVLLIGGDVQVSGMRINQGNGFLEGSFSRQVETSRLEGTLTAGDFLFTSRVGEQDLAMVLSGQLAFLQEPDHREMTLDGEVTSWRLGAIAGDRATFRAALDGERIVVDRFEIAFPQGTLTLAGECVPYRFIDLAGNLSQLKIPENEFGFTAELLDVAVMVQGSWDEVFFTFSGQGHNLSIGEGPLGESFEIELAGRGALPKPGETVYLERYLDPSFLDKGFLRIYGVQLDQLGLTVFQEHGLTGTADFFGDLLFGEERWVFETKNLLIRSPAGLTITGDLAGSFVEGNVHLTRIQLFEAQKGLSVIGSGVFDPVEGVAAQLRIEADIRHVFQDHLVDVHLVGSSELTVEGLPDDLRIGGDVFIRKLIVSRGGEELLRFSDLEGHLEESTLLIKGGVGEVAGFLFRPHGVVSSEGIDLTLALREEEGGTPVFAGLTAGQWRGTLTLSGFWDDLQGTGDLILYGGLIDKTQLSTVPGTLDTLGEIERSFHKIPFPVKLSLRVGDALKVKTRFLDLTMSGGLEVLFHHGETDMAGRLAVVEGEYDLVMHSFPLQGYVVFGNLFGFVPQIDFEGRKQIGRHQVTLRASGPLDDYRFNLEAQPDLSQEELLSLLILGSTEAYGTLDRIKLTGPLLQGIQFLLGDPKSRLTEDLFFDSIEWKTPGAEEDDFFGFTLNKEFGENLIICFTQDLSGQSRSSVGLSLDLNQEWSFQAELAQEGAVEWMLEYHTRF